MQKYKVVASKSQKKYTLIISADSETQAKEKLHKDSYSILSIHEVENSDVIWNKFIFQVEKDGNVKNGAIIWKDIFKVYVKLIEELEYNVVFLYPEGDGAHDNAEKKQEIMDQLVTGYALQKKENKQKKSRESKDETFYLQKELNETYSLIWKAIEKFDSIFNNREQYNIEDDIFFKLERIYEKLIHVKWSTNLTKLKAVWELALVKIAEIELRNIEENKNQESRELLKDTNNLLKQIGSSEHFIEEDKDIKRKVKFFFREILWAISFSNIYSKEAKTSTKTLIDKNSYSFLKTVLLLEKYNDKLSINNKEMRDNGVLFLNPFSKSELKEKIILKRKVIKQNISILKAKKSWWVGSYTRVKKWYWKISSIVFDTFWFLCETIIFLVYIYIVIFLTTFSVKNIVEISIEINTYPLMFLLFGLIGAFLLYLSKNIVLLSLNIVFLSFIFIFSLVNF